MYRRFKYQTFIKFLFSFVLLLLATVNVSAWYFYYTTTRQLDDELSKRLASLASTCAIALDGGVLAMLHPGDEGSLLYQQLQAQLERMQEATKGKVYLVDKQNRYLVDVKGEHNIGSENLFLRLDEQELQSVRLGQSDFSTLYRGADGRYYKSGYAPVRDAGGDVTAVLVVEASAQFFDGVKLTRRRLFYIGGISVLIAVTISAFFAQSLVAPLQKLVKTVRKIESGDLSARVKLNKRNEFGFLSNAFDKMVDTLEERETELRNMHREAELMAAGLAHEIRNPLGAMQCFVGLLRRKLTDTASLKLAEKLEREVGNLEKIVADFLAFTHPRPPELKPISPSQLVQSVLTLLSDERTNSAVEIQVEIEPKLEGLAVWGDVSQLRRVLLNLLLNAFDAMPDGGTLSISANKVEKDGRFWLQLDVKDTGNGVPDDIQKGIFDPFFTTKRTGIGLGLSIAKKLVEGHEGSLELASTGKDGSTFRILLPINS